MAADPLRPYQLAAVESVYAALSAHDDNPCVVIPTGGGKTHVIAQICQDAVIRWKGRVLVLAHRKELLEQNAAKIQAYSDAAWTPGKFSVGVYSAGLNRRERVQQVIVAGIQSAFKQAANLGHFDLVLIDEAHLIPPYGEGMYRTLLEDMKKLNNLVRCIGFTATPYRMTSGAICAPENILNTVCYEAGIPALIADGYLCNLISKNGQEAAIADTSKCRIRGGEFMEHDLECAFSEEEIVRAACAEILKESATRNKILIFCCGIKHAGMVTEALQALGAPKEDCAFVCADTPAIIRAGEIASFRNGKTRFMVNVNVLTEGFDAPNIDMIALLRATQSPGLYYQMVGRGLRVAPGKANCLVLDFGENVMRHGPIDQVRPRDKRTNGSVEPGETVMQICQNDLCRMHFPAAARVCPHCGTLAPEKEIVRHGAKPEKELPILSTGSEFETSEFKVTSASYDIHTKRGAGPGHPRSLKATYYGGINSVSEWVCLEHEPGSFPHCKATNWWKLRTSEPVPPDVDQAVRLARAGALRSPSLLYVRRHARDKELPKILSMKFETERPALLGELPNLDADGPGIAAAMGLGDDDIPF